MCRILTSACLRYTQYGLCVLPTGVAVAPMLTMLTLHCYTQYSHCVECWCQNAYAILSMVFVYYHWCSCSAVLMLYCYTQYSHCVECRCQNTYAILSMVLCTTYWRSCSTVLLLYSVQSLYRMWCQNAYAVTECLDIWLYVRILTVILGDLDRVAYGIRYVWDCVESYSEQVLELIRRRIDMN